MAEELLGRRLRRSTAAARTSSSPTTRTRRPRRAAARGRELARHLDAQRDARSSRRREDGQVGRATSRSLHEAVDAWGRDALLLYFAGGALPPADRLVRRRRCSQAAARRGAASARRRAGSTRGASPEDLAPLRERVLRRAGRRLQHAGALAALCDWVREANRREEPVGDAHLRRDARACSGSRTCSRPERGRRRPRSSSSPPAPSRRAPSATSPRPTACATRSRARGWEVRDTAGRLRADAARVIVYGRNAVREALRAGRRPVHAGVGDARRGAASRGCGTCDGRAVAAARDRAPAAARPATRASAPRSGAYPYAGADELLARARPADRRARRGPGPAERRRGLPHGRVRRARPGSCSPSAARPRSRPRSARRRPARSSTCAIARVRNLADFLRRGQARPAAGATARRPRARALRRARTTAAASSWCSARRAGAAPAGRGSPATRSSRCRCAARSTR